jgi:hypothetical protein
MKEKRMPFQSGLDLFVGGVEIEKALCLIVKKNRKSRKIFIGIKEQSIKLYTVLPAVINL